MRKELIPGTIVWLDADMAKPVKVTVISQTSGKLYTKVKSEDSEWDVMTYRLTLITE